MRAGGEVRRNTPARGLIMDGGRVIAVETDAGSVPADAVILTPALPIIADILRPHVKADYAERIGAIGYLANVCVVLELTRSLSELYWMNVNDPNFHSWASSSIPISIRQIHPAAAASSIFPATCQPVIRFLVPRATTCSNDAAAR